MAEREEVKVVEWVPGKWWVVSERFVDDVSKGYTPLSGDHHSREEAEVAMRGREGAIEAISLMEVSIVHVKDWKAHLDAGGGYVTSIDGVDVTPEEVKQRAKEAHRDRP